MLARPNVAITDSPRVRPRKLPKPASLSLGEALSFSHRSACRDSSDTGVTMYSSIAGADLPLTFVVTFIIVLVLVGFIARAIRRYATLEPEGSKVRRPRQPRVTVIEHARIDAKRCLLLIRRDEVEHLLMIGGEIDIVIEADVVRAPPRLSLVRPSKIEIPNAISWTESDEDDWPLQPTAQSEGVSPAAVWLGVEKGLHGRMPPRAGVARGSP